MTERHPNREMLRRFMSGELDASDSRGIVLHLLSGCEACRRLARDSLPCGSDSRGRQADLPASWRVGSGERYAQIFEQVLPKVWESELSLRDQQERAPQLLAELLRHPHERRVLLVRNSHRFRGWALCELIIDEAFRQGFEDPATAIDLGRLAVLVAETLEGQGVSSALANDLGCRAHAILGNALRIAGDLAGASEELAVAEQLLDRGTGDLLERARLLELRSYVAGEHRDFAAALGQLDEAIRIYRAQKELHRLGRALVIKGHQLSEKGDIAGAVGALRQGLRHIDREREPRLTLVAKHNLVRQLYQTGRYHQALALLPEVRELHASLGSEMDRIRFAWLEGTILRDSGQPEAAETLLDSVKRFFVGRQIVHDAALVSLDLAAIYLRQQRTAELKRIAGEMLTIFHALHIHREAIAALVLFQKAVELERVSLGLVRDLAAYLRASRHDPRLPFRPSTHA